MNWINKAVLSALRWPLLRQWVAACLGLSLWLPDVEADPLWWIETDSKDYLFSGAAVDNDAAANVGQLKNFAYEVAWRMGHYPTNMGGAGAEIDEMLRSWDSNPNQDDYAALTAGQAKAVAKKFYDRLAELHALPPGTQPWPATPTAATDDYAVINIGQLKNLFSFELVNLKSDFDGDGMSNGFELQHGLNIRVNDAQEDADNDGLSNLWEFWLQLDPRNEDSDGDLILDRNEDSDLDGVSNAAEIAAGPDPADPLKGIDTEVVSVNDDADDQLVLKNALAPVAFSIKVREHNSWEPLANVPVVFEVLSGQGLIEDVAGNASSSRLIAHTDDYGEVTMRFRGAAVKDTSKVRVSLLRMNPSTSLNAIDFDLWTSQWATDADGDGMDDAWEQAIIAASSGTLTSIEDVLPLDDFDRDGVPNVFEYDRGTDPVNAADYPLPDVILDQTGAPQGAVPVKTTWGESVLAAAVRVNNEHPETHGIIKIMPGSYPTNGGAPISRSILLWGQGSLGGGLPILTSSTNAGSVINTSFAAIKKYMVFAAHGLVIDGGDTGNLSGLSLSGSSYFTDTQQPLVRLTNCIIRHCGSYALDFDHVRASLVFTTITDCGAATNSNSDGSRAIDLYNSSLDLRSTILWNGSTAQEILPAYYSTVTCVSSIIRGGAFGGMEIDPELTVEGRLTPGSPATWYGAAAGQSPLTDIDGEQRLLMAHFGADQLVDSDGDGLSDVEEAAIGTNRWLADTDGDGVGDLSDALPFDPEVSSLAGAISVSGPPVIVLINPTGSALVP